MPKLSAGLLPYRRRDGAIEVFLVHPGGPFWAKKDDGAWTIAKGEPEPGEEPLDTARREFREETGLDLAGPFRPLAVIRQAGGKTVQAWAVAAEIDAAAIHSNEFTLEWPPRSGRRRSFPEIDRAQWFAIEAARTKINRAQAAFLDELIGILGA